MYDFFQKQHLERNEPFDWLSYWTDECHYTLKHVEIVMTLEYMIKSVS